MSNKSIVKKDNALINAAYTLSLSEQRLILLSIVEGAGKVTELKDMSVHASEYAERFNVSTATAYEALDVAAKQLFERKFSYQRLNKRGNLEHVTSRWVSRVAYVEKEGTIKLRFADDVLPLLTDLQNRFTAYSLEAVAKLTSAYAVRLYELLIAWRSTLKTPVISIQDLRLKLGVLDDEYERMNNFKARVLDISVRQINKHSDINVQYEQHKKGRTITGFSFTFTPKNPKRDPNTIDMFSGATDAELGTKPKRKKITQREAEAMAFKGESWQDLLNRIGSKYHVIMDK